MLIEEHHRLPLTASQVGVISNANETKCLMLQPKQLLAQFLFRGHPTRSCLNGVNDHDVYRDYNAVNDHDVYRD